MNVLLLGFGLGFCVALQLGPLSLFAIRSTLRSGVAVGLAIGAAVAVIDTLYAAAGAAGAAGLLRSSRCGSRWASSARWCCRISARDAVERVPRAASAARGEEVATPRRAFATALGATASNPLTIASWAAVFAAAAPPARPGRRRARRCWRASGSAA